MSHLRLSALHREYICSLPLSFFFVFYLFFPWETAHVGVIGDDELV